LIIYVFDNLFELFVSILYAFSQLSTLTGRYLEKTLTDNV